MAVEVKVTTATLGSLGASVVLALANAVVADSTVMGGLPAWLQFVILAILPPVITWLSGYAMPSQTSKVSDNYFRQISGKNE